MTEDWRTFNVDLTNAGRAELVARIHKLVDVGLSYERTANDAAVRMAELQANCAELLASRRAIFGALSSRLASVVMGVVEERRRQDLEWTEIGLKDDALDDDTCHRRLRAALNEAAAATGPAQLRAALVRVAAVAVGWVEAIDGRAAG